MSYTKLYYHIVFRTYTSEPSIPQDKKALMFAYIFEMCKTYGWHLLRINSYLDHIHILLESKSSDKISDIVKAIKGATSSAFKHSEDFPGFKGWNKGYGVFSLSYREIDMIRNYIINQEQHHQTFSTKDEFKNLLLENGLSESEYEEW